MRKTHKNNNSIKCDTLYTIQTSKTMIGYTDNIKNNKGEYIMSKIKQYIETSVENAVDKIIKTLKDGQIDFDTCKSKILDLDNLSMVGIDSENIDEVIQDNS